MTEILKELKQHALMEANTLKSSLPPEYTEEIDAAYVRAKIYEGIVCPRCWVKEDNLVPLSKVGYARKLEIYRCDSCDFQEALSNSE